MSVHSYISGLTDLFRAPNGSVSSTGSRSPVNEAFSGLILFLRMQINREDLLDPLGKELQEISSLSPENADAAYLHLYAAYEDILVSNKPPITKKEYTRQTLRQEIQQNVKIDELPQFVRVLFMDQTAGKLELYILVLRRVCAAIVSAAGDDACRQYIRTLTTGTLLSELTPATGALTLQIAASVQTADEREVRFAWIKLFVGLYEKMANTVGEKLARATFEQAYALVKQSFDYDLISSLIEVFPREITEKDRLQYLSREELEKKIIEATRVEKEKRAIIEKLARDLQEKVEDLHKSNINILAYEKALEEAKANVERQVAERTKQLLESQERLFKFLETLPMGVFVFDRRGGPYFVNAALKRLIGNDISNLASLEPIRRAYRGESTSARDIEIDRGEKRIQLEIFASPIFDSENTVEFVIAAFHDITEEKVLERSKDEFFSIASHELRTPLTAIRGLAWILRDEYAEKVPDKEFKTMINDIYTSSIRLIDLVNDFLDMSRLEQGRMIFKNEQFEMKGLVEEVVKEYTIPAQEKGLFLRSNMQADFTAPVVADRSKVKEALINFIGNALKFTKQGGITVHLSQELDTALIRVEDTGMGVPRDNQALLFRKFQQAGKDIYTRDMSQGSGLGLYISKLMIQGMHGTIGLESSNDKGSVFFLSLPLAKPTHSSKI